MTAADLRRIRMENAASKDDFARALGYVNDDTYRKYETGTRPIPPLLQKLAIMIDRYGMPEEWTGTTNIRPSIQGRSA